MKSKFAITLILVTLFCLAQGNEEYRVEMKLVTFGESNQWVDKGVISFSPFSIKSTLKFEANAHLSCLLNSTHLKEGLKGAIIKLRFSNGNSIFHAFAFLEDLCCSEEEQIEVYFSGKYLEGFFYSPFWRGKSECELNVEKLKNKREQTRIVAQFARRAEEIPNIEIITKEEKKQETASIWSSWWIWAILGVPFLLSFVL